MICLGKNSYNFESFQEFIAFWAFFSVGTGCVRDRRGREAVQNAKSSSFVRAGILNGGAPTPEPRIARRGGGLFATRGAHLAVTGELHCPWGQGRRDTKIALPAAHISPFAVPRRQNRHPGTPHVAPPHRAPAPATARPKLTPYTTSLFFLI